MAGLQIYATEEQLAVAAAEHFITQARQAIEQLGTFSVVLSGGKTPRAAYSLLGSEEYARQVDWRQVHVFWSDERCVPPDHSDSNYRMAHELLLDRVHLPKENIHRMKGELRPELAAAEYDAEIRRFFGVGRPGDGDEMLFDLAWLGIGADGHTASLFPLDEALEVRDRWAVAVEHRAPPKPLVDRITLTIPALQRVRQMMFTVTGAEKSGPLRQILQPEPGIDTPILPAARVWPESEDVLWLVDTPASSGYREGEM